MKAAMSQWWDGREPRERTLLGLLAGLVLVFLLVFVVVLPIQSVRANAEADLDRAKSELALVSRLAPALSSGASGVRAPFDRSVLIQLSRAHDVKLTRVQPGADGAFDVWIDDTQTQNLYGLFEDLLSDYAVTMDRAVISADANNRLSAQFTVR